MILKSKKIVFLIQGLNLYKFIIRVRFEIRFWAIFLIALYKEISLILKSKK